MCDSYEQFLNGDCICDNSLESCVVMGLYNDYFYKQDLHNNNVEHKWFLRTGAENPACRYLYQVVIQLENHEISKLKGTLHLTLIYISYKNGKKESITSDLEPPKETFSSGLRMPFVVTSDRKLDDIIEVSLSWTPKSEELLNYKYVDLNNFPYKWLKLPLKYIRITPVEPNYKMNRRPKTRFYCNFKKSMKGGLLPFHTINLKGTYSCM